MGQRFEANALDEAFAKAFEILVTEVEVLVDSSTECADKCDADRQQFTDDALSKQNDSAANEYLHSIADQIVSSNRLIRSMLPKKAVFAAIDQVDWPDYICKTCIQRMEACVAVFSYLEARAGSNLEQLNSLQDSFLSMINLSLSNQGMEMNVIMQRFAVVTLIMAPLTLVTGFFGMNVPIPGPSMNPDDHDRWVRIDLLFT
jgi:Mg2+ and Co2+ transporter CorA